MGRKTRRTWAPLYLQGLLGPGERKSLQPMVARLGLAGHDQLQHFVASTAWNDGPLWTVLAQEADRLVGGSSAHLVIDDTALPKKGTLLVGVARQCCGQLGKRANCQSLVLLTLAQGEGPVPVALRLCRPDEWATDAGRCARAGIPEADVTARSKGEIALCELELTWPPSFIQWRPEEEGNRISRICRAAVPQSCGVEDAGAQEREAGPAIHGPLQHFQPVDLALGRACGPG